MEGLVADHAFIPDLDPDRVEEDQRINRVKRPLLPGGDLVEDRIGHRADQIGRDVDRSEEHTSELQSLMRISYAVFCLKKKTNQLKTHHITKPNTHTTTCHQSRQHS